MHVSKNGHVFPCPHPETLRQAYHVIFVIDNSTSMSCRDRQPLANTPSFSSIAPRHPDRFGAVLSGLFSFWTARAPGPEEDRRDAYSVLLFAQDVRLCITHDTNKSPAELLNTIVGMPYVPYTNFVKAIAGAEFIMKESWSADRAPVIIFLSDGECALNDQVVYDLCDSAVSLGNPLRLYGVSFGRNEYSHALRRMVAISREVAQNAVRGTVKPAVPSEYSDAMTTINLAETFLDIAASLTKPRAALIRN